MILLVVTEVSLFHIKKERAPVGTCSNTLLSDYKL